MGYVTSADVFRVMGIPSDGSVISESDIDMHIVFAEDYVERVVGTTFQPGGKSVTEVRDGNDSDTLFLDFYPVISLDSLSIDGVSVDVSKVYLWPELGKLRLGTDAEVSVFKSFPPRCVSVSYTYGETPDQAVIDYTAIVAAMHAFIEQIGGTFDDVTSFSVPDMSGSLGEPYTNIREALNQLKLRERELRVYIRPKFKSGGG